MGINGTSRTIRTDLRQGRYRRPAAIVVLAGTVALTACGGNDDEASEQSATDATIIADMSMDMSMEDATADAADGVASDDDGFLATGDPDPESPERAGTDAGFDIGVIGRDVIVEMRVVVSSDDIERTVASVMAAASTLGGGLSSSDVNYGTGTDDDGYAVLVVKIPPDAVDRLLIGLRDSGDVQSINQNARDVTDQLVDLGVRIANARTSVDNVRTFMGRTENLSELVTLEAELTRRQTELEQLEAQQRNLSDRVALSTITIEIVPTASEPEALPGEENSIGDAFRSGWDAFAAFAFGIAVVVAATLPFVTVGLILAVTVWMWTRRRDHGRRVVDTTPVGAGGGGKDLDAVDADREPEPVG